MKNIFINSKFGDKFITRDGSSAIYISIDEPDFNHKFYNGLYYKLYIELYGEVICYEDGHIAYDNDKSIEEVIKFHSDYDIMEKYHISDNIIKTYVDKYPISLNGDCTDTVIDMIIKAYKDGMYQMKELYEK